VQYLAARRVPLSMEAVAQRVVAGVTGARAAPVIERCPLAALELPTLQMSIAVAEI